MSKIVVDDTMFLGGHVYASVDELINHVASLLPQTISIIHFEKIGLINTHYDLLENGTVLKTTITFADQQVYDIWKSNAANRWRKLEPMLGWEMLEGPTVTLVD